MPPIGNDPVWAVDAEGTRVQTHDMESAQQQHVGPIVVTTGPPTTSATGTTVSNISSPMINLGSVPLVRTNG